MGFLTIENEIYKKYWGGSVVKCTNVKIRLNMYNGQIYRNIMYSDETSWKADI